VVVLKLALFLAVLCAAALLATRAVSEAARPAGEAPAAKPARIAFPPSPVPPDAPLWRAETLTGDTIAMADYRGRITVVDFWGTWCGACVAWLPRLVDLEKRYAHRGVAFLTVNVEFTRTRAAHLKLVREFMERRNFAFTVVPDADSSVVRAHGVTYYPTVLVIDPNGRVRFSNSGASREMEAGVARVIDELLAMSEAARP
jgi:thiol-disulfide isomerase/thioredoxin